MNETSQECGRRVQRRREGADVKFPLVLPDGMCIVEDRRRNGSRRRKSFIPSLLLFKDVHDARLVEVLSSCPVRECVEGEILLAPGQANHSIYLVLSGRLLVRLGADGAGPPLIIESGQCVGELSIIDGKPVSAFVVAEAGCRVLEVADVVFWSQIISLSGVARNLLTILSERMRQDNEIIIRNVRQRLHYEHLEKELQTARSIQASMLPKGNLLFPGHSAFEMYALMDPAREIGGDFFDAFMTPDNKLFFAIGDVSGKGIPAALFMVKTVTLLRMEASRGSGPHEILARVNRELCANNDYSMFVTVFCGVLDIADGTLLFCNGGHDAPLVANGDTPFAFVEGGKGVMLGVAPGGRYELARIEMRPGASMLCYTDGVTEATNAQQLMFERERLRQSVAGMEKARTSDLVQRLHTTIRTFVDGAIPADDIALLALTFTGGA